MLNLKTSIAMAYIQIKPALHTSTKCKLFILCLLYLQGHFIAKNGDNCPCLDSYFK